MKTLVMAVAPLLFCAAVHAEDAASMVKDADRFRLAGDDMQVQTQVSTYNRDGGLDKERAYLVFVQSGHQSLVLMQSPAEKGQKVLMRGDDFWLLMPQTQRPLRITPSQKLLGDASTGDIATLSWSDDYDATLVGEERCDGERPCTHLSLVARRPGVSYQRIELWVGTLKHEPLRADLYLQSDKLAKQARFVMDQPAAPTRVDEMQLQDQLGNHKETRVRYGARQARTVPAEWLNPMFLARNPSLE